MSQSSSLPFPASPNNYAHFAPHLDGTSSSSIRKSGFLLGDPVAFTTHPSLPHNYPQFSPKYKDVTVHNDTIVNSPPSTHSRIAYSPYSHEVISFPARTQKISYPSPGVSRVQLLNRPPTSSSIYYKNAGSPEKILESIPKIQFDQRAAECKMWEQRYNELYSTYISQQNRGSQFDAKKSEPLRKRNEQLKKQNQELKDKIRKAKSKNEQMVADMQENIKGIIQRSRQSALKETKLLVDRHRLECRAAEQGL